MNQSILALSAKHQFSQVHFSSQRFYRVSNCYFSGFFGHCFFLPSSLFVSQSCFSHFLSSCIHQDRLTTYSGLYTNRPSQPDGSPVTVVHCEFRSCTANSGGAIFQTAGILRVSYSSFYQCRATNGYGGALHFDGGTESTMYSCCGFDCSANSHCGQFLRFVCQESISCINHLNMSSASVCSTSAYTNTGESTILAHGSLTVQNFNSSFNYVTGYSSGIAPHCNNPYSIGYCTIISNIGLNALRLIVTEQYANNINIVNNTNTNGNEIIKMSGNSIFSNCYIIRNNGVIFNSECTAQLHNCYIYGTINNPNASLFNCITNNNNPNTQFMTHINTYHCKGATPLPSKLPKYLISNRIILLSIPMFF